MSRIEIVRDSVFSGGRHRSRACVTPIDFGVQAKSAGVFTGVPAWLAIACASTARSVQQSASAIVAGLGANAFRAYSVNGSTFYLLAEGARTNQSPHDASAWPNQAGTVAISAGTDPAGNSTNVVFNDTDAASASFRGESVTVAAGATCVSAWTQNASALAGTLNNNITGFAVNIPLNGNDVAWVRREAVGTATAGAYFQVAQPRTTANQTGPISVYGYQIEAGKYPGSVLGPGVSRAADVASSASPSLLCPGGFFHVKGSFAPLYASTEQGVDHDIFFLDSSDRLFLRQSDNKLVLRIGGADLVSAALGQSRNQLVTYEIIHSPRLGRRLIVNGTATTGSVASAVSLPATLYIGGGSSGAEEGLGLGAIGFYKDAA